MKGKKWEGEEMAQLAIFDVEVDVRQLGFSLDPQAI